jgi:hypothetical protein
MQNILLNSIFDPFETKTIINSYVVGIGNNFEVCINFSPKTKSCHLFKKIYLSKIYQY